MNTSSCMRGAQVVAFTIGMHSLACSADEECSAFDWAPRAAVITFEDEDGNEICEFDEIEIVNTVYPDDSDVPDPDDRDSGFTLALVIVGITEKCEFRVGDWFDREAELPVEAQISGGDGDPLELLDDEGAFEAVEVSFDVETNQCGDPVAADQTIRLVATADEE